MEEQNEQQDTLYWFYYQQWNISFLHSLNWFTNFWLQSHVFCRQYIKQKLVLLSRVSLAYLMIDWVKVIGSKLIETQQESKTWVTQNLIKLCTSSATNLDLYELLTNNSNWFLHNYFGTAHLPGYYAYLWAYIGILDLNMN